MRLSTTPRPELCDGPDLLAPLAREDPGRRKAPVSACAACAGEWLRLTPRAALARRGLPPGAVRVGLGHPLALRLRLRRVVAVRAGRVAVLAVGGGLLGVPGRVLIARTGRGF